jgi:hypothetical protein
MKLKTLILALLVSNISTSLLARNLFLIENYLEVKQYKDKVQKGDFALIKQNGTYIRYVFDGNNFVAINDNIDSNTLKTITFSIVAKSCKDIKLYKSGIYTIDPDGESGNKKSLQVYCDMKTKLTLYYIENGKRTYKVSDKNSCQDLGLMLFAPKNKEEYLAGMKYLKDIKKINLSGYSKAGPLGIYHPTHNSSHYTSWGWTSGKPMNSYKDGSSIDASNYGWKSINGGNFWISNRTNISEPNGDYYKSCWLGIWLNNDGSVSGYNDGHCDYSYTNYLCMSKDK